MQVNAQKSRDKSTHVLARMNLLGELVGKVSVLLAPFCDIEDVAEHLSISWLPRSTLQVLSQELAPSSYTRLTDLGSLKTHVCEPISSAPASKRGMHRSRWRALAGEHICAPLTEALVCRESQCLALCSVSVGAAVQRFW